MGISEINGKRGQGDYFKLKHEATRYEHAEGLSASIKNPNETISLFEKSRGFLLMLTCSDFLARQFTF